VPIQLELVPLRRRRRLHRLRQSTICQVLQQHFQRRHRQQLFASICSKTLTLKTRSPPVRRGLETSVFQLSLLRPNLVLRQGFVFRLLQQRRHCMLTRDLQRAQFVTYRKQLQEERFKMFRLELMPPHVARRMAERFSTT
jgi:hypothetical protein